MTEAEIKYIGWKGNCWAKEKILYLLPLCEGKRKSSKQAQFSRGIKNSQVLELCKQMSTARWELEAYGKAVEYLIAGVVN